MPLQARPVPLQEYQPRIPVEEGLRRVIPHVSEETLEGPVSQLGGAVEQVARGEASRFAMDATSRSQEQWLAHLKEAQESAPAGAPGFTGQVMGDYQKYMRDTLKAAPSPLAQKMLQPHLSALGLHLYTQASNFEAASRHEHGILTGQESNERAANMVSQDPSLYDQALAQQTHFINGLNLDPNDKEKLAIHAKASISTAAVTADINHDPYDAMVNLTREPPKKPQATGLVTPGTIRNLWDRPILRNPDGSISTTQSFSIGTDKGEVLIPQVVEGKRLSRQEAISHYRATGEHLGVFDTAEHADQYASALHNAQAQYIHNRPGYYNDLTFEQRQHLMGESDRVLNQRIAMAEHARTLARQELKDTSDNVLKQGATLDKQGKLTPQWVMAREKVLEPGAYIHLLDLASGTAKDEEDPDVYIQLALRAHQGQDVVGTTDNPGDATVAFQGGLISPAHFERLMGAGAKGMPDWIKRGTDYITTMSGYSEINPNLASAQLKGRMIDTWNDWVEAHPNATIKEAQPVYQGIVAHEMTSQIAGLPPLRYGVGPTLSPDLEATKKRMRAQEEAGNISRAEVDAELRKIEMWEQVMRLTQPEQKPQNTEK